MIKNAINWWLGIEENIADLCTYYVCNSTDTRDRNEDIADAVRKRIIHDNERDSITNVKEYLNIFPITLNHSLVD